MLTWLRPTAEQAATYGRLVAMGVPVREAVGLVLPYAGEDERRRCEAEWPVDGVVAAAVAREQGGQGWSGMSEGERIAAALRMAYGSMAYAVFTAPPTLTSEPAGLKRVLDFVDLLERQADRIAKLGVPVSGTAWTAFLEQAQTDPRFAEVLKAPKDKRVQ